MSNDSAQIVVEMMMSGVDPARIEDLIAALREEWGLPPLEEAERIVAPCEYLSTHFLPDGFDTVVGYFAKYVPHLLLDLTPTEVANNTTRDGFWCKARCAGNYITVPAPSPLRTVGIDRVNAYPVQLLRHRLSHLVSTGRA